jgi:hypothetical protein
LTDSRFFVFKDQTEEGGEGEFGRMSEESYEGRKEGRKSKYGLCGLWVC